jgi:uncharacterized phage protein gp47/JayE
MSIKFPINRKEVSDRAKADVQSELPESNPFLKNSFLGAIIAGFAGRIFDFYLQLKELVKQMFPDTATGAFMVRWGEWVNITRNAATEAEGNIVITGTDGTVVPLNTVFQNTDGLQYETKATQTITDVSQSITSITRSGSEATATTPSAHNLATGMSVTISGANEAAYNGTFTITATSLTTFTYEVSGSPSSPATGTITLGYTGVSTAVRSIGTGKSYNASSGSSMTIFSPLSGIDDTAYVDFGEIGGGTDIETDTDLKDRVQYRYANPVSLFNASAIIVQAKKVAGVTRVFVETITPYPGAVTVYFTRDNDASIIPSASEVTKVKDKILEITPGHTEPSDVVVSAPTAVTVDFTFTGLSPNTATMQDAIENRLEVLFEEETTVGADLKEVAYESIIWQTIDPETGDRVSSFTLSSPSGDVSISSGEIPVLGTVTFP